MIKRLEKLIFDKIIIKLLALLLVTVFISIISRYVLGNTKIILASISSILAIVLSVYIVVAIVHLIRLSYKKLFTVKNIYTLAFYYVLFIIGILLILANLYAIVYYFNLGYLTKTCNQNVTTKMIAQDAGLTKDYFYFSAITFFTVGYGDICPVGFAKIISIINAFIGNFTTVVVMMLVLNYYVKRNNKH